MGGNQSTPGAGAFSQPMFMNRRTNERWSMAAVQRSVKQTLTATVGRPKSVTSDFLTEQLTRLTGIDMDMKTSVHHSGDPKFRIVADIIQNGSEHALKQLKDELAVSYSEPLGQYEMKALHLAALYRSIPAVSTLMSSPSIDVNVTDKNGNTPMILAILGARNDASVQSILLKFLNKKECQISHRNIHQATVLHVAAARGFSSAVYVLLQGTRVEKFTQIDLLVSMRLAMLNGHQDVADILFSLMDYKQLESLHAELFSGEYPEFEGIRNLIDQFVVPSTCAVNLRTLTVPSALVPDEIVNVPPPIPAANLTLQLLEPLEDESDIDSTKSMTISEKYEDEGNGGSLPTSPLSSERLYGSGPSNEFLMGNTVRLKSFTDLKHHNPSKLPAFHHGAANKIATILEISSNGDLYVDVLRTQFTGFISPQSVVWVGDGPEIKLSDRNTVSIGYYAEVTEDKRHLYETSEQCGGWRPEMEECCRKTGRIVQVNATLGGVYLQFAGTDVFFFSPKALELGSVGSVQLRDESGNWLKRDDFVGIYCDEEDFQRLQVEAELPQGDYLELVNQTLILGKVRIYPGFSKVEVTCNNVKYVVHSKCLAAVAGEEAKDQESPSRRPISKEFSSAHVADALQEIPRSQLSPLKLLGQGGFGQVFTGLWQGADCAIKKILTTVTDEKDYREILKEARVQSEFRHPNIVQLYGISYERDLWMVMQFVAGVSLDTLIFENGRRGVRFGAQGLSYKDQLRIAQQAAGAISYIHSRGYVHGDIKPQNMLVEKQTGNLLVCDFGITRYLGVDFQLFSIKYTNTMSGTLFYLAPEIYSTEELDRFPHPTYKSDVWSMGAVFLELFTGKPAFDGLKSMSAFKCGGDMSALNKKLEKIKKLPVTGILEMSLHPTPESRPLCAEISEYLQLNCN